MTTHEKAELRVCAAALFVFMLGLFALVAWTAGWGARQQADAFEWRAQVQHLQDFCDQRADGSAECRPEAFTPYTTTTVQP